MKQFNDEIHVQKYFFCEGERNLYTFVYFPYLIFLKYFILRKKIEGSLFLSKVIRNVLFRIEYFPFKIVF